jgi:hypothetical protein
VTDCSFHAAVPEPASRTTDFLVGVNADILILQEVGGGPLPDLLHRDCIDRLRGRYQFRSAAGELGGWFRPGLVRSDPRGGELKKSGGNRGALHGDFHGGEAYVFAGSQWPVKDLAAL